MIQGGPGRGNGFSDTPQDENQRLEDGMNTAKKCAIALILAGVLCAGGIAGYMGVTKFLAHERAQNQSIAELKAQVSLLSERVADHSEGNAFVSNVSQERFDYLAIGNSITIHPVTDYWWGEWGMAASGAEHDYWHLVIDGLEDTMGEINSFAYNYYSWEVNGHDRAEAWELLDDYLVPGIDLITIQLSENTSDLSTFGDDLAALITHIEYRCEGGVKIILVDDFWDADKSEIKKTVAKETGVDFVDLADIRGKSEYMSGMGMVVKGSDGNEHVVDHRGVSVHPGDTGMAVIAKRVLEFITK